MLSIVRRRLSQASVFVFVLLAVELLDELVFGLREAAWPLIRDDLSLTYAQIGILMSVPGFIASLIEPVLGILADVWRRRLIIVGGGFVFMAALLLMSASQSFLPLLLATILLYPASGAFVSLSQASLMDYAPDRHEQNMARWTLAGSLGVVGGPLLLGALVLAGGGWRDGFAALAGLALVLALAASRLSFRSGAGAPGAPANFWQGARAAVQAIRRGAVLRWLILLMFSDFMLDILLGYLALYFVDVAGVSEAEAGIAVAVWTGVGLVGDFLLIPLLERVRGLVYLRFSALVVLALYPAFLLVPDLTLKLVLLALLGLFDSGWYPILQAQLYSALPGQSGTALAANNVFGFASSIVPLLIGMAAQAFGLEAAMWLLALGPAALAVGLPRARSAAAGDMVSEV